MDPRNRQRLEELFARGSEMPVPERATFCERECGDDPALCAELRSLLDCLADDDSFLREPAPGVPPRPSVSDDADSDCRPGIRFEIPQIPGYENLELVGSGGMGSVYRADQVRPFRRRVAVKLVRHRIESSLVLSRFEVEYHALARMQHRFIATVYDAGVTTDGRPYFAMEYVEGVPIHQFCDRERLDIRARIGLFVGVCRAVQHAHRMGILHRDLKPANILVTRDGDEFVPKVIDFGIAKPTSESSDQQPLTLDGMLLGTLEYMSPEQALGGPRAVDTRSDVYSMGVVLYELLTGVLPLDGQRLRTVSPPEFAQILRDEEPPLPSARVARLDNLEELSARRNTSPTRLRSALVGDLDWVTLRAIDKDPDRRFASPLELERDLARFLRHEPVESGPPSAVYRARRLLRRYRTQFVAGVLVFASLITGVVAISRALVVARRSASEEAAARADAEAARSRADASLQNFRMLSLVVRERRAAARAETLFPPWPSQIAAMEDWLTSDLGGLIAALPEAEATLARMEAKHQHLESGAVPDDVANADDVLSSTLRDVIARIESMQRTVGMRVRTDLAWARRVEELTVRRVAPRWEEARRAILAADGVVASEAYRTHPIDLRPQLGLVPIGMNPVSKLWEFYLLRSAWDPTSDVDPADLEIPTADDDGRIDAGSRGVVLVLIPGDTFAMGAQATDPTGRNYDPRALQMGRFAVQDVTLAPFFIAKHEMTVGQWSRLAYASPFAGSGATPKVAKRAGERDDMPVHLVDHPTCSRLLAMLGLVLPTEAQWEYACRAGTHTPWATGSDPTALSGVANVRLPNDQNDLFWPVGTGLANRFGLHDMHGNVWEWCQEEAASHEHAVRAGDGLRLGPYEAMWRIRRGGSFRDRAEAARSANRLRASPSTQREDTGLRAARPLDAECR